MSLGNNPANLRWLYMLDNLIDMEIDEEKVQQLRKCQGSIRKYPLSIHNVDELRLFQHFKNETVDILKATIEQDPSFLASPQNDFSQVQDPRQPLGDISGTGNLQQSHPGNENAEYEQVRKSWAQRFDKQEITRQENINQQSQRNEPLMTASPIYDNSDEDVSLDLEPEPEPIPSPLRQAIESFELDQNLKPLCGYGKTCSEKRPLHFRIYRHPKDVEGSEDDIKMEDENEILGKFRNQKLQEAKDYKLPDEGNIIIVMDTMSFTREQAIKALKMTNNNVEQAVDLHLSQEESEGEDEYDKICKKPSAAFETNNTASVSRVFDEAELSENDGLPAPSTSYALPNRRNEIPDLSDDDDVVSPKKLQETKPKKSAVVPDEGNIIKLMDIMSSTREQATKALKMTDNDIERAVGWILAHPGDINQETESESQVFDDVFPAPSTSYALPNRRSEITDHSDSDDIITSPHSRERFKKVHQMVGGLEKVKEKDQEQKNYEMAIRLSQQDDPKPKSKGKKKRGIFEIDPIMARFGPGAEEASERKKRKKTPKKTPASSTSTSGSLNQPSTSTSQRNEPLRTASPIYDSDSENDLPFDIESGPINSPPERRMDRNEMATPRRSASASPRNSQRKSSSGKKSSYCPRPRSGGYAILVALYENRHVKKKMSKDELCKAADEHSDESMTRTRPGSGQWWNGYSAAKTLVEKELIIRTSRPVLIWLTEKGLALAAKIMENKVLADERTGTNNSSNRQLNFDETPPAPPTQLNQSFRLNALPSNWNVKPRGNPRKPTSESNAKDRSSTATTCLRPGNYDIILLVDKMEVVGGSAGGKQNRKNITPEELRAAGVIYEERKLPVGDFLWIARSKCGSIELVLPYVVERKRLDDLRSSMIDGRYGEQKQRIKNSGISHKIYLVEEIGYKWNVSSRPMDQLHNKGLDRGALDQAMSNTYIRDGFNLVLTNSQKDSMRFLRRMTETMIAIYRSRNLKLVTDRQILDDKNLLSYQDFNEFSRPNKPLTARHTFCNMLICQSGLSPGMAWAITDKYPTVRSLLMAFGANGSVEAKEKLLAGIPYDNGTKKIPAAVSKIISYLFNDDELN